MKRLVLKEFIPEGPGELGLLVNQLVTITYNPTGGSDEHCWVYGYNESSLEEGWFPLDFTRIVKTASRRRNADSELSDSGLQQEVLAVDQILAVVRLLPADAPKSVREYLEAWARE